MEYSFNRNRIFFLIAAIFTLAFIFSVIITERSFMEHHKENLNKTSQIVSEAVWTMYTDATLPYLNEILHDRAYKSIQIYTLEDMLLIGLHNEPLSGLKKAFLKLGLIRTANLHTEITHKGERIGEVRVMLYNIMIFTHLNNFLIALLFIAIAWFYLKLQESKNNMEKRVIQRTEELNINKERLSFALSAARSGIWDWRLSDNSMIFDENYYIIAGYEPYEFPADYKEWKKRVHPDTIDSIEQQVKDYISGSNEVFSVDFQFLSKDGSWMWMLAQGKIIERDDEGNPVRFIGTHTDITHIKAIAEELKQSEERYFTLFNNSYATMLLIDPTDGSIEDANPAASNYYGYSLEKLKSMKANDLNNLSEDDTKNIITQILNKEENILYLKHQLSSGEIRDVEIYTGPIEYKGRIFIFSIVHDISKRRKAEKQLHDFNKNLLKKVNEEIDKNRKQEEIIHNQKKLADMGNMISAISHQWRQPLNALGFYIQDVADAVQSGDFNENYLSKFESDSMDIINHLSTTIDDFRYFFQPDKEAKNLNVVEEIFSLLRLTLAQIQNSHINIKLICKCQDEEFISENLDKYPKCIESNATVKGYKGEFKQVIANLIYNSIDAIKGNGQQDGLISVRISEGDGTVTIAVCDNGGGIPINIIGNIFSPYFSTKSESKGTGIGLYMSKAIIEEHMDGKISFENTYKGVCFIIKLPQSVAETASIS